MPPQVRSGGRVQHLSHDVTTCDYSVTHEAVYRESIFVE